VRDCFGSEIVSLVGKRRPRRAGGGVDAHIFTEIRRRAASGAPRSMKMGTTRSLSRYDAGTGSATALAEPRYRRGQHYAKRDVVSGMIKHLASAIKL
jgi:hypothetical protein